MLIVCTLMLTPGPPGMTRTAEGTLDAGCEPTAWARTLSDSIQLLGNLLYLALYSTSFSTLAIVLVGIASACVRCQIENNRSSKSEFHLSSFRGNQVCVCVLLEYTDHPPLLTRSTAPAASNTVDSLAYCSPTPC
jgi:hypothetical protein